MLLQSENISYPMHLELFFKIGYVCKIPKVIWMDQDLTQFAMKILCDDSTSFGEVGDTFATKADIMIDIVFKLDEDKFIPFAFYGNIY